MSFLSYLSQKKHTQWNFYDRSYFKQKLSKKMQHLDGPSPYHQFFSFFKSAINLISLKLEPNIFKIFTSLWYLPLVTISKKKMLEVRVTCHGWFNMALPSEAFFSLNNSCCEHCRNVYTHFHSSSCLGNILLHQNHATY